ncbi:hypothetical protein ACFYXQ_15765 [Nocardia jiangxiensis]|uniref:Isochorismatase family protein n=1 Tax=Nocardia jiangxiensis TaxID=282685 RepID=A0ABW6RYX8_9NOCA
MYTMRPPEGATDPIGNAMDIAAELGAVVIVVYDLAQVDDQPARVCEGFDLETVCPAETWARIAHPVSVESGAA